MTGSFGAPSGPGSALTARRDGHKGDEMDRRSIERARRRRWCGVRRWSAAVGATLARCSGVKVLFRRRITRTRARGLRLRALVCTIYLARAEAEQRRTQERGAAWMDRRAADGAANCVEPFCVSASNKSPAPGRPFSWRWARRATTPRPRSRAGCRGESPVTALGKART